MARSSLQCREDGTVKFCVPSCDVRRRAGHAGSGRMRASSRTLAGVSEALIRSYERDGAVIVRGAFPARWIELLRRGVEFNLRSPGPYGREYAEEGGRFFGDYVNWERIGEYRDFAFHSGCAELAAAFMAFTLIA